MRRTAIFNRNLEKIRKHNEDYDKKLTTYRMSVNQFTDLSRTERSAYLGLKEEDLSRYVIPDAPSPSPERIPRSVDWVKKGMVQPVQNQGNCGSCWAFAAVATIEPTIAIHKNKSVKLSEQSLLDCIDEYGCEGGHLHVAFGYIMRNGIPLAENHPYVHKDEECPDKFKPPLYYIKGCGAIEPRNETLMRKIVADRPVAVTLRVNVDLMQYGNGTFDSPSCDSAPRNHAVVIVGYGKSNGVRYWKVRNSWGKKWGDQGYFKIKRGVNMCGIADIAHYVVLGDGEDYVTSRRRKG